MFDKVYKTNFKDGEQIKTHTASDLPVGKGGGYTSMSDGAKPVTIGV